MLAVNESLYFPSTLFLVTASLSYESVVSDGTVSTLVWAETEKQIML
jgi:hypothetical protein